MLASGCGARVLGNAARQGLRLRSSAPVLSAASLPTTGSHRSSSSSTASPGIAKVGVMGLGLMGHGIMQAAAMAVGKQYKVVGVDATDAAIDAGRARIESSLKRQLAKSVAKGTLTESDAEGQMADTLNRMSFTTDRGQLADVDIVIEAITENPAVKLPLYQNLGELTKPECILASNTSSLAIGEMARASGRPQLVVGLHFFNPVQVMKLVEVVKTDQTDPLVFDRCKAFVQSLGKHPVSCKDTPGFIVNRLLVPALAQAMMMVDRGDATVEDIDKSMELGAGHPMGPLALADYVGLDTCLAILQGWMDRFPTEPAFVVPKCLKELVAAGKLGRKSGAGFYSWQGDRRGAPASRL